MVLPQPPPNEVTPKPYKTGERPSHFLPHEFKGLEPARQGSCLSCGGNRSGGEGCGHRYSRDVIQDHRATSCSEPLLTKSRSSQQKHVPTHEASLAVRPAKDGLGDIPDLVLLERLSIESPS